TCVNVEVGSIADLLDLLLIVGAIAIPVFAVLLIARIARRAPAEALLREGRRAGGLLLYRWGISVMVVGVLAVVAAIVMGSLSPGLCEASGAVAASGVVVAVIGALLAGGGSSYARRAGWMVLATVAALDIWIFYINLLAIFTEEEGVEGLLLLAFAIHAACMAVAAWWSFTAKDLGPIERAKAGEAGRALAAVWVFLASYSMLSILRTENAIFDSAAGSAVAGALTLGALAVTMGSGYTKYAEAIYAKPSAPTVDPDSAAGDHRPETPPDTEPETQPYGPPPSSGKPDAPPTDPATTTPAIQDSDTE
ncbi:MAG TPA: hypothetical protein VES60_17765, partial [Nakamurella sp.]|nr:hypothetical protein [Nakamurella sp.]